jgi:Flp pilus assembly pilin Flp
VEYALLLALITLAVAAVLPTFTTTLNGVWTAVGTALGTQAS